MPRNIAAHARTLASRPPGSRRRCATNPTKLNGRAAPRSGTAAGGSITGAATLLSPLGPIPACAGTTAVAKHHSCQAKGPPPRARGRRADQQLSTERVRTIPAGAGTTKRPGLRAEGTWDHPRVREDNTTGTGVGEPQGGSPPRRGDDISKPGVNHSPQGPPLRGQGRLVVGDRDVLAPWTTPASAGTTCCWASRWSLTRDNPRRRRDDNSFIQIYTMSPGPPPRRGDDYGPMYVGQRWRGPPPQARGRPARHPCDRLGQRITPQARGRHQDAAEDIPDVRITPARAG